MLHYYQQRGGSILGLHVEVDDAALGCCTHQLHHSLFSVKLQSSNLLFFFFTTQLLIITAVQQWPPQNRCSQIKVAWSMTMRHCEPQESSLLALCSSLAS